MTLKEMWLDMPVWMRVLMVAQLLAGLSVMGSLAFFIHHLTQRDWPNGLEGVWLRIWKGQP